MFLRCPPTVLGFYWFSFFGYWDIAVANVDCIGNIRHSLSLSCGIRSSGSVRNWDFELLGCIRKWLESFLVRGRIL